MCWTKDLNNGDSSSREQLTDKLLERKSGFIHLAGEDCQKGK